MTANANPGGPVSGGARMGTGAGSVDAAEIARFEAMAAHWWSATGPMKALHEMNPVRVGWLCEQMAAHFRDDTGRRRDVRAPDCLTGLSILDIGCGGGILSESLARLGASVTGLEPAAQNLAIARTHAREHGLAIDYRPDTAEVMAAAGQRFDVVCAMEVVEHVAGWQDFVACACELVRPGGLLFISTLNRTAKSFALAIIGAEYVLRWVPAGTHQWEKFITPGELRGTVADAGLKVSAETGIVFNPLSRRWRVSRDMAVNYMIAARRRGP